VATGTPVPAVAGQAGQMSAAYFNAECTQPFVDAYSAWTTYIPTWTTAGTQPVRNNGTIDGAYKRLGGYGKTVRYWFRVTFGSTTTYGTGSYNISLPFVANARGEQIGLLRYNNGSGNYVAGHVVIGPSGSAATLWVPQSSTSPLLVALSSAATLAPASTGWFTGEITYESA
jgi:hypothetical protein